MPNPIRKATPADYLDVFERHPAGQIVLEDLVQRFTRDAVTKGGIDAVLETYLRIGSRRVVDAILTQINRANGVPDQPQGDDDVQA